MKREITVKGVVACLFAFFLVLLPLASGASPDTRILLFEKFNRANTYEEIKPLVSGVLANQLAELSTKPDEMHRALNYFQLVSYDPRIVEINDKTSFLVLEHAKSKVSKNERAAYLLSRSDGKNWTLASRVMAQSVITSLWTTEYSPAEFNQSSTCSVRGTGLDPSLNGKQWNLQSAVGFRTKDTIEIDLYPFQLKKTDLDYWKFWSGMAVEPAAFQTSPVNEFHPECRIVFGLDTNNQITFVNVGFNDPKAGYSRVWQGPGWSWAPPQVPKPSTRNGLPSEFPKLEITQNRIKLETAGELDAGNTIRWKAKINIPLWQKGL